jgi:hypothetical protein
MDAAQAPAWAADPAGWLADVEGWVGDTLDRNGLGLAGPPVVAKNAPWSIVLRVPTTSGGAWFKQGLPALGGEAALVAGLATVIPAAVPAPLGADADRDWLLLPDLGPTLRSLGRDADPALWAELVGQWSLASRAVCDHADGLAAREVPRLAPGDAAGYLRARIDQLAALPAGDPAHLGAADAARLHGVLPRLIRAGEELAALGLPVTLWHNDLHTNNVFACDGARFVFFDFGDALLGSPLADLLIPLRFLAHAGGGEFSPLDDPFADPGLTSVVEAAIEPWTDLAPAGDLRAAVGSALLVGALGRSESWRRAVSVDNPDAVAAYGSASTEWLLELAPGGTDQPRG